MKKNALFNTVMILIIVLMAVGGVVFVGNTKGWFGEDENYVVSAKSVVGSVDILRSGVSYTLDENTPLREGDIITAKENGKAVLVAGEDMFTMNNGCEIEVTSVGADGFGFCVKKGDIFAVINGGELFSKAEIGNDEIGAENTVCLMSAQTGSYVVSVLEGEVSVKNEVITAGNSVSASETFFDTSVLEVSSLSDFAIRESQALAGKVLCFTDDEFQQVLDDREEERLLALAQKEDASDTSSVKTDKDNPSKNSNKTSSNNTNKTDKNDSQINNQSQSDKNTENKNDTSVNTPLGSENKGEDSDNTGAENLPSTDTPPDTGDNQQTPEPEPEPEPSMISCTIKITCSEILDNMDQLEAGKDAYVPSDGVILSTRTFEVEEGTCVFDVLKKACNQYGIQLEYSWTPGYNSNYVEGINHIYEFDCGETSGWKYKVNGWYPNYGSSQYEVEDGDSIVWSFTCDL